MRVRILGILLVPQLMNCSTATGGDREAKDVGVNAGVGRALADVASPYGEEVEDGTEV